MPLNNNQLNIELFSPYVFKLLKFINIIVTKQHNVMKHDKPDNPYRNSEKILTEYFKKNSYKMSKIIHKFQTQNIMSFLDCGIITNKIPTKYIDELYKNIINFSNNTNIDYHPNSNNVIRDIVHPSLYPLLKKTDKSLTMTDIWNRPYEESDFQWLPSEFKIDKNGKCKISSYINNLPITNTDLYTNIENIFNYVFPYFENMWSYINNFNFYSSKNYSKKEKYKYVSLKNRNLQIITKIVQITLKPKDEIIGAWHIEGMPHEHIVATASCTIQQDTHFDATLYFKRMYTAAEGELLRSKIPQFPPDEIYKLVNNIHVPLGKSSLVEKSLIVFPNSHIHTVYMKNNSSKILTRTILVFWLIDPNHKITSTEDIMQQKYSLKNAHENRLKLMEERTFHKQTLNQREINLCEH